jgi:hypothetical protein
VNLAVFAYLDAHASHSKAAYLSLVPETLPPALLRRYLTTTLPFMPCCSWPSTGQYIS